MASSSTSLSILYHSRMQYLKPRRDEHKQKQRRRTSSLDLFQSTKDDDTTQFSCLDEKLNGPCTPDILVPPSELMTRSRAFQQAFWKHHARDSFREVERLEINNDHRQERERLNMKRKEILARIKAKEAKKRQADMRKRAERFMNRDSSGIDDVSDESDDDSEIDTEQIGRLGMLSLSPSSPISSPYSSHAIMNTRRTGVSQQEKTEEEEVCKVPVEVEVKRHQSAFSFLSEWGKEGDEDEDEMNKR
jgi:hypothetical protein